MVMIAPFYRVSGKRGNYHYSSKLTGGQNEE